MSWVSGVRTITLFVDDLPATRRFYEDVFAVRLIYEDESSAVFDFGNLQVNLLVATEAGDVVEPLPVAPSGAGTRALLTINVEDTDATVAELTTHGVTVLNGPVDRRWGVRTAAFRDPGGHVWEIASDLVR
jgi:lactoylglutathione lyase